MSDDEQSGPTSEEAQGQAEAPSDRPGGHDAGAKRVDEQQGEQARREKEETEAVHPEQEARQAAEARAEAAKPSLAVLINSIATQVFVGLGAVENPLTNKKEKDLLSAKFSIDLLQTLADKTKGNLTTMEDRYLQGVLHELHMHYVEAARTPDPPADANTGG